MTVLDFINYRSIFKNKYEQEADNKKKFIEGTFDFAKKGIEVICKTISGAYGTKSNTTKLSNKK